MLDSTGIRRILLSSLARNQSFDAALREGRSIDSITAKYLQTVLFETNAEDRASALKGLQAEIVREFDRKIQPAARAIGVENAKAVLAATPPAELPTATFRKRILYQGKAEAADRVQIVHAMVNDRANTLENRLTAYYLEPGLNAKEKLATLKHLHKRDDEAQKAFTAATRKHLAGEGTKPRKPTVDYMARLTQDVKQDVRVQARRAGTAAETQAFQAAGHELLSWCAVNASVACVDCRKRQGVTGDIAFWNRMGKPGAGTTLCKENCCCLIIPSAAMTANPDLQQHGLNTRAEAAATRPAIAAALEAAPQK